MEDFDNIGSLNDGRVPTSRRQFCWRPLVVSEGSLYGNLEHRHMVTYLTWLAAGVVVPMSELSCWPWLVKKQYAVPKEAYHDHCAVSLCLALNPLVFVPQRKAV